MPLDLITVNTSDGVELDGALYRPDDTARPRPQGVLMVHGLTWNFYRGPSRWLPPLLVKAGYTCLSINMRDHDLSEPKDFGLAHYDLRAGIDFLFEQGSKEVLPLAHGFACNKVICYPALSGDTRIVRWLLTTLGAVKTYRPDIWDTVLAEAKKLQGEALVVQGAIDHLIQARERAAELKSAATESRIETVLLDGANHYFDGRHDELAKTLLNWIEGRDPNSHQ